MSFSLETMLILGSSVNPIYTQCLPKNTDFLGDIVCGHLGLGKTGRHVIPTLLLERQNDPDRERSALAAH